MTRDSKDDTMKEERKLPTRRMTSPRVLRERSIYRTFRRLRRGTLCLTSGGDSAHERREALFSLSLSSCSCSCMFCSRCATVVIPHSYCLSSTNVTNVEPVLHLSRTGLCRRDKENETPSQNTESSCASVCVFPCHSDASLLPCC